MNPLAATWLCWAIIGLSPIAGKYAVGVISPVLLVFLGTLIGVLYFTPWITKNHKWGELLAKETRWKFLFIGTFGTAARPRRETRLYYNSRNCFIPCCLPLCF